MFRIQIAGLLYTVILKYIASVCILLLKENALYFVNNGI